MRSFVIDIKPVWDVIKALRSLDDDLGEQLDELRRQLGLASDRGSPIRFTSTCR